MEYRELITKVIKFVKNYWGFIAIAILVILLAIWIFPRKNNNIYSTVDNTTELREEIDSLQSLVSLHLYELRDAEEMIKNNMLHIANIEGRNYQLNKDYASLQINLNNLLKKNDEIKNRDNYNSDSLLREASRFIDIK